VKIPSAFHGQVSGRSVVWIGGAGFGEGTQQGIDVVSTLSSDLLVA